MPLKPAGQKILGSMMKHYGAKKGKSVFYAKTNKDEEFKRRVEGVKKHRGK